MTRARVGAPATFGQVLLLLRAAQGALIVQVVLGALLLISGREADDGLHYLYGTVPPLVNMFAEGMLRAFGAPAQIPSRSTS